MENALRITDYLRAGYSCFWLQTTEPRRAVEVMARVIDNFQRKDGGKYSPVVWDCVADGNPLKPLNSMSESSTMIVSFLMNYHWFIDKPPIIQTIQNNVELWKGKGQAMVVVSHKQAIPAELEKDFLCLDFPLPDNDEIVKSMEYITESTGGKVKMPKGEKLNQMVNTSKGLTQLELENVLARSVVEHKNFVNDLIAKQKASIVEKNGLLEVVEPTISLDDVIGYDQIKKFVLTTIDKPSAKGILILGPPGCGKTMFMNGLIGSTGKIGLNLNFGKMFSKFQGETDTNIENAIKIIEAIGDCVVMVDEFEKQFAGAASTGDGDSGVTRRATGRWLRFMQDRPEGVYIIGTCNSFKGMPPEYLRPGRWDSSPFFIDLPTEEEKEGILLYYIDKLGLDPTFDAPDMELWTGAEIEACCRNADMMNVSLEDASTFILPQAKTMENEITELRAWSEGRTIPATVKIVKPSRVRMLDN